MKLYSAGLLLLAAALVAGMVFVPGSHHNRPEASIPGRPLHSVPPPRFPSSDRPPFPSNGASDPLTRSGAGQRTGTRSPFALHQAEPGIPGHGSIGIIVRKQREASLFKRSGAVTPAVSVEIPQSLHLPPGGEAFLQQAAQDLHEEIATFPQPPESAGFAARWIDAVRASDLSFRQRYGQHAWMEHHIQAHHLLSHGEGTR